VQAQQIVHARSGIGPVLTLSLGVDTVVPTAALSPDEFVARVDRLLYQARIDGRDRSVAGAPAAD
jgi:PleD family two-component response regulator